jgi:membrane-associated protease RseP (regulator of RpoE activity)
MSHEPLAGFPAPLGRPPAFEHRETPRESSIPPEPQKPRIWLHLVLFALTAASMQFTAMELVSEAPSGYSIWTFAAYQSVSLLGILLVHELGHYVAARLHRVPASMPYFLPLPRFSLFGTLGAVISMRDRIRSRTALLDIGAAGPIAGMVVAVPILWLGLKWSVVTPQAEHYTQEGQSILYWLMKRLVLGPMPANHDVTLHPMAFAGWGGLFLTMINLLPWGQLDGGHIAYALFGERQHVFARWVRRGLLLVFAYNVLTLLVPSVLGRSAQPWWAALAASIFWLMWYAVTGVMGRVFGEDHPPVEPGTLGFGRKLLAVACLIMFVLLFLPTPLALY